MMNEYDEYTGGDDRKILAYALFVGSKYDNGPGIDNLTASSNSHDELFNHPRIKDVESYEKWQIIDTSTFKIISEGDDEGPRILNGVEVDLQD